MNEDFEIHDPNGVDDLFRDSLGDFSENPGDISWKRLNRKLNRKELSDFVTFKKTPVSAAQALLLPIYRKQWFRGVVAAGVVAPSLFVAGFFIARSVQTPSPESNNTENNNTESIITTDTSDNQEVLADNTYNYNSNEQNSGQNTSTQQNDQRATTHQQNGTTNKTDNKDTTPQHSLIQQMNTDNITDLLNDPVLMSQLIQIPSKGVKDSARYQAARLVDSIIQANAIIDNQISHHNDNSSQYPWDSVSVQDQNALNNNDVFTNDPIIIIPKAFTPNSDGLNDVLFIDGLEYYPENTFVVHNANGAIVYSKKEYRGDWNAEGVPDGIYIYFLTYKNKRGVSITIKGVVTIIR